MAYANRFTYTFTGENSASGGTATYTVRIMQDGYGGASETIEPSGLDHTVIDWQLSDSDELSPLFLSSCRLRFLEYRSGTAIQQDLFDAGPREFKVEIDRGGSLFWAGYLDPEDLSQDDWYVSVGDLRADDGLSGLREIPWTDGSGQVPQGQATLISILADVLSNTGLGLPIKTAVEWRTAAAGAGDPLALYTVDQAVFNAGLASEKPEALGEATELVPTPPDVQQSFLYEPVACLDVLRQILQRFGLRLIQSEGAWWVLQVPLLFDPTSLTVYSYDAAGTATGSAATDLSRAVTAAEETDGSTLALKGGLRSINAATVLYRHGKTGGAGSLILNPTFDTNPTYIGDNPSQPFREWTLAGTADEIKLGTGSDYAVQMDPIDPGTLFSNWGTGGLDTDAYPTAEDLEDPNVAGNIDLGLSDYVEQEGVTLGATTNSEANQIIYTADVYVTEAALLAAWRGLPHYFVDQVQLRGDSGTTYYLDSDGAWQTGGGGRWIAVRAIPEQWYTVRIQSDDLPEAGTVYVKAGPVLKRTGIKNDGTPGGAESYDVTLNGIRDNIRIRPVLGGDVLDGDATELTTYLSSAAEDAPRFREEVRLVLGDGPTTAHLGSLREADGSLTETWARDGVTESLSIDQLLTRSALRLMQKARTTREAQYFALDPPLQAHEVLSRDGDMYVPYRHRLNLGEHVAGGTLLDIRQDAVTSPTDRERTRDGIGALLGGTDGSARVLADLRDGVANLALQPPVLTLDQTLVAGEDYTQITVLGGDEALDDGQQLVMLGTLNAEPVSFYVRNNYAADATTLDIEATKDAADALTMPATVVAGAGIFATNKDIVSLIAQNRQAITLQVTATLVAKLDQSYSGTGETSLNVDTLRVDVKDDWPLEIRHTDGTTTDVTADGAQSAEAGTLAIDDGSGGAVTITADSGDEVHLKNAEYLGTVTINADEVRAEVVTLLERREIAEVATTPTAPYTSIDLTAGGTVADLLDGQKLIVGNLDDARWVDVTVDGDQDSGADPLTVLSTSANVQAGDVVLLPDREVSSLLRLQSDNLTLRTQRLFDADSVLAEVNGTYNGSATTTISLKNRSRAITAGDVMLVFRASDGRVTRIRATADLAAGTTAASLSIQSANVYADDGDSVREGTMAQMRVDQNGFRWEADIFASSNWNGTEDGAGNITGAGTQGWALSGQGDADITGTLHFGSGAGEVGDEGIEFEATNSLTSDPREVRWIDPADSSELLRITASTNGTISVGEFVNSGDAVYDAIISSGSGLRIVGDLVLDNVGVDTMRVHGRLESAGELVVEGSFMQVADGTGDPATEVGAGRYYSKSNTPYFRAGDGTTYDLSGSGSSDADTLDGLDSTQFLRSDQNDTMSGDLTVTGVIEGGDYFTLPEVFSPGVASSGKGYLWNNAGKPHFNDDAGNQYDLTQASGAIDADTLDGLDGSEFGVLAQNESVSGQWTFDGRPLINAEFDINRDDTITDPSSLNRGRFHFAHNAQGHPHLAFQINGDTDSRRIPFVKEGSPDVLHVLCEEQTPIGPTSNSYIKIRLQNGNIRYLQTFTA